MAFGTLLWASASGSSLTLPAHAAGDLILIFAYRDGSTTAPSLPSGWASIHSGGANTNSARLGVKRATSSSETSGTWSNATEIVAVVIPGGGWIGGFSSGGNSGTSISYPALTMEAGDGTSLVLGFAGHRTATNVEGAPTGMTNATSAGTEAAGHTGGLKSSWSAQSVTVNASSGWRSYTVEIRPAPTISANLWSPANLATPPRVWWDGDRAVFANGVLVAWPNRGSEGGLATIGGSPTRATVNGLNGGQFDASGEKYSLTVGQWGTSGVQHSFAVFDQIAQTSGLEGLFHRGAPGPTTGVTMMSTSLAIYLAGEGYSQGPAHGSPAVSLNPVIVAACNGTTQSTYVNGIAQTLDSPTAGTFPNYASATYDYGESWDGGAGVLNGSVEQLMQFDYVLSADDRQKLEGWAAWKYGLEADLLGGHPYAGAAPTLARPTAQVLIY